MGKGEEAQKILKALGLPVAQQNEISALSLLALCGLKENDQWKNAINNAALAAIKSYGSRKWKGALETFLSEQGSLILKYQKNRTKRMIPVTLADGTSLNLSPGKHNRLQSAIITEFAPRFSPGAMVLYLGDTAKKNLIIDEEHLKELCIVVTDHDKLPDVVLFDFKRNWLFLIEAVTSHGPVTPKRMMELDKMLSQCAAGKVYVSAFPDFAEFRKHMKEIAWETKVAPYQVFHTLFQNPSIYPGFSQ